MKCHQIVIILLVIASVEGSFIELNETTLSRFPALNGFDDWSSCQRPGDVYCMVEAKLFGDNAIMQLLEDYSSKTLKHYNRTVVHRGVCVTRCDTQVREVSWHGAAQACLSRDLRRYGLQGSVTEVRGCEAVGARVATTGARALSVLCLLLLVLAAVATTLHLLSDHCTNHKGNKYLRAFSLKQNWTILTLNRMKPKSDDRMKNLAIIEGIRVVGMQGVIFWNVIFFFTYGFTENPQYIEKMYDTFFWQAVMNTPLLLQAFFSISAFLTAYTMLIYSEKRPVTMLKGFMTVISRWMRLTPAAMFTLGFTVWWLPLLGSGPAWWWTAGREAEDCADRWWYHLLYIQNHLPQGKFCMTHTWYLAAAMQLHVVCVALTLLLIRRRQLATTTLALLLALSAAIPGIITYLYDLMPIVTMQAPESVRNMFSGSASVALLLMPSYSNLSGPVGGVAAAFLLHHYQTKHLHLREKKYFRILFRASLFVAVATVLVGAVFLRDEPPPRLFAIIYSALDRTIVAVLFSVFLLGCVSQCRSTLISFLRWRGFQSLGRLSYCVFLLHPIVLRLLATSDTRLLYVSGVSLMSLFITVSVLTYFASIPLCLLIEIPFIELWKAVCEREARQRLVPPPAQPSPQAQPKPFDLVAQLSRNHQRVGLQEN